MEDLYQNHKAQGEPVFYYHSDHLGSASYITDDHGNETQHLVYLPFGELRSNREYLNVNNKYHEQHWVDMKYNTSQFQTPYKFNGKEKDSETGYNNFGARYYYDWASIWLSVDPMSDKYPHVTSYNYCANNPIMLVDPDGRDVWEVNEQGKIINRITDKTQDAFQRVDDDGNKLDGENNFISFNYGTIKERNHNVSTTRGEKTLKIFEVKGDDNATAIFNFLIGGDSKNKVEWGHVKIGEKGSGRNLLGTANKESSSYIGGYAYAYNYTIRENNHNHPKKTTTPSEGDVNAAKTISDKFNNAKFNIFVNPGEPIPYNKNSDFIKPDYPGSKTGKLTPGKSW